MCLEHRACVLLFLKREAHIYTPFYTLSLRLYVLCGKSGEKGIRATQNSLIDVKTYTYTSELSPGLLLELPSHTFAVAVDTLHNCSVTAKH